MYSSPPMGILPFEIICTQWIYNKAAKFMREARGFKSQKRKNGARGISGYAFGEHWTLNVERWTCNVAMATICQSRNKDEYTNQGQWKGRRAFVRCAFGILENVPETWQKLRTLLIWQWIWLMARCVANSIQWRTENLLIKIFSLTCVSHQLFINLCQWRIL